MMSWILLESSDTCRASLRVLLETYLQVLHPVNEAYPRVIKMQGYQYGSKDCIKIHTHLNALDDLSVLIESLSYLQDLVTSSQMQHVGKPNALPTSMIKVKTKEGLELLCALFDHGDNDHLSEEVLTVSLTCPVTRQLWDQRWLQQLRVRATVWHQKGLLMNGVSYFATKRAENGMNFADMFDDTVHYPVDLLIGAEH